MIPTPSRIAGRAAHEDGAHPGLDAHLHGPGAFLRHPWVEPLAANSSAGWANQRGLTDFPRRVYVGLWRLVAGGSGERPRLSPMRTWNVASRSWTVGWWMGSDLKGSKHL